MEYNDKYNNFDVEEHKLVNGRILLRMPVVKEDSLSSFVRLPEGEIRKRQLQMVKGELVSFSEKAFPDDWEDKPEIGDWIFFFPYSGNIYLTDDKEFLYRHISCKDITGFEKK